MAHTTASPVALVALSPTQVGIPASSSPATSMSHFTWGSGPGAQPVCALEVGYSWTSPVYSSPTTPPIKRAVRPLSGYYVAQCCSVSFLSCGPIRDTEAIEKGRRFGSRRRRSRKAVTPPRSGRSPRPQGRVPEGGVKMAPAKGWSRTVGSARSFVGNALGGVRGWSNAASWAVAGSLAYYLWVRPARQLKKEQEERAALTAASDPYRYVEKRKPIPDPQDTGLTYGKKKDPTKSDN